MRRAVPLGLLLLAVQACAVFTASAQDLATAYREARIRRIAVEQAGRRGMTLAPRPPDPLGVPSDTIRAWLASLETPLPEAESPAPPDGFVIDSVQVIRKLERSAFSERFAGIPWAFHQGRTRSVLDTTMTRDLRARLEAHFGAPTRTLAEMDSVASLPREAIIQFEYWFVVNDSIPVIVIDVNGFLDRGLVVASDARHRDRLDGLARALLERLEDPSRKEPYVDYYFQFDTRAWYVSGYDGASFFTRRIERPDLNLGRPFLGTYVPGSSDR